jgi:hypothetical protein
MSVFFEKKLNQANSSVVNNMQYNLFTIFPLSGPFAEFGFVFIDIITYFRFINNQGSMVHVNSLELI